MIQWLNHMARHIAAGLQEAAIGVQTPSVKMLAVAQSQDVIGHDYHEGSHSLVSYFPHFPIFPVEITEKPPLLKRRTSQVWQDEDADLLPWWAQARC